MRLAQLQQEFQQRVLFRDGAIEPELLGAGAPDFQERLGAYVEGYRSRLIEALGTTYSALKATLGEEEFAVRMRRYIESTPSRHYSVRYYGAAVGGLMAAQGEAGARATLSDLARWEWTLAEVFDAPDDEPLSIDALGALPPAAWAGVSFRFRACVRRLQMCSNAVDYWRAACQQGAAPAGFAVAAPTQWLLWRRGVATLFRSLDATEALLLDAALSGESFGALCERLVGSLEETQVAMRAASLLKGWISEELIAAYRLPDATP